MEGWDWDVVGLFLSLRDTYIPNLSTLLSLELLKKVPGGWMGGGWVVLESHFSIQLKPKPRGMTSIVLCPPHLNKKPCYLWQVKCLLSTNIVRLCFIVLTPRNILPLTRLFVFAEIISETCKAEKKAPALYVLFASQTTLYTSLLQPPIN